MTDEQVLRAALVEPKCHCDSPGWCKQYSRCHRKMLGLPPAPKAEPVAWAMPLRDGVYIDIITPEEHARMEGQYTVPLYAAPQPRKRLTEQEICEMADEALLRQALEALGNCYSTDVQQLQEAIAAIKERLK